MCGEIGMRNSPHGAVRIKSIFLASRGKFVTVCGHRENRAELGLIKHPIKIHGILPGST